MKSFNFIIKFQNMKLITCLSLLVLFFNLNAFSQEPVVSFKIENVSKRIKKDSYSLSNIENNDLAIVLIERNTVFAYLFDSSFKQKVTLESNDLKNKYNEVIGYSINNSEYHVLYTNDKKNKFAILNIDFEGKNIGVSEIEINYEDEIYIDALNYKNKLYFLTASDDLKLTIRAYDNHLNFDIVKTFSLDEIKDMSLLLESKYRIGAFFLTGSTVSGVTKIDQRIPNTIEQTSSQSKLYQNNNKVYLTFENSENKTSIYDIDLETYTVDFKTFDYPKGKIGEFKKFNSYIYEDKFYQIASSKDEMKFLVNTIKGELIKEFYINNEASIKFKNSPIIQEGITALPFVNKREMEETKKYLRKITSGDVGLTVLKNKDVYYITMGGFQVIYTGGPMVMTPTYNSTGTHVSYNPTFSAYNSYSTTKSTYFNSIFDLEFNHIRGSFKENVFDKIKTYQSSKSYITAEDVFFHNNSIYYGYFNLKEGEYNLVKF